MCVFFFFFFSEFFSKSNIFWDQAPGLVQIFSMCWKDWNNPKDWCTGVNIQICVWRFPILSAGLFWIIFRLLSPRLSGATVGQCNKGFFSPRNHWSVKPGRRTCFSTWVLSVLACITATDASQVIYPQNFFFTSVWSPTWSLLTEQGAHSVLWVNKPFTSSPLSLGGKICLLMHLPGRFSLKYPLLFLSGQKWTWVGWVFVPFASPGTSS